MKVSINSGWFRPRNILVAAMMSVSPLVLATAAMAQNQAQFFATQEEGYGRLVLSFPTLDEMPKYTMRVTNGVMTLDFDDAISVVLPDVASIMPEYLSVARMHPEGKGLRLALRTTLNFNRTEAGNKLFIDLLPPSWQGPPPTLPQAVIDEMNALAQRVALREDQQRKARVVAEQKPQPTLRVGRNPTFLRLQFDWTIPTGGKFAFREEQGNLDFEWPVPVDLRDLLTDLPREIETASNIVTPDGSLIKFRFARGVEPRFYSTGPNQHVLDIDIEGEGLPSFAAESLAASPEQVQAAQASGTPPESAGSTLTANEPKKIAPYVSMLGNTVRVVFPFEQEVPSAIFKRGGSVWLFFDTSSVIQTPEDQGGLAGISTDFAVTTDGDAQIVRIDLSEDRLATMGSEGQAWVLSLGDVMMAPTEPMELVRRRDMRGDYEIVANVQRPGRVHEFRDPLVGDILHVTTAYPPARGITRTLDYVDFSAMQSVHGLVVRPKSATLEVQLENALAVISAEDGLEVSTAESRRMAMSVTTANQRPHFVDFAPLLEPDPQLFAKHRDELEAAAAASEGRMRDAARLDLANYLLANGLAHEALGILRVAGADTRDQATINKIKLSESIGNILAGRARDAITILDGPTFKEDIDAYFWRAIARSNASDFAGARSDAVQAYSANTDYADWARSLFLLAAGRAAIEEQYIEQANDILSDVEFATLREDQVALFSLLTGRLAEAEERYDAALDIYGQVIATEVRPRRAEAVYRTLQVLDLQGRLDVVRGAQTLGAEALMWRGDGLEAAMQGMLADLYFRSGEFRQGFESVMSAVASDPESRQVQLLSQRAQDMFNDLFLNGRADTVGPIEALGIYYDFQQLTPPGARGDEMIRNLARRMVRVDLLPQAAELLQYQLDNRLRGVARTEVASDLAVIYLAEGKPAEALGVLNETRLPDLPESLNRQRRILEARAFLDGGRDQLALDLLRDQTGQDVELMRIDAHWMNKRYAEAGQQLEALYPPSATAEPMTKPARMGVLQAAVGYVLSNDKSGIARLRSKYSDVMASSPEWPMFDFVTGPVEITSIEFRQVAAQIAAIDGLETFLAAYREVYEQQGALTPISAAEESAGQGAALQEG